MKTLGWMTAAALVAGGVALTVRGGCLNRDDLAPDERLAKRFDQMCKIARSNVDSPVRGVKKLGAYLDKHTGDLFGDWGDTLAAIERITDDAKHDKRARLARNRISRSFRDCEEDWMRFGEAVENDPEASTMVEEFSIRLNRTFEIIFSGGPRFDLANLPRELDRVLDQSLR